MPRPRRKAPVHRKPQPKKTVTPRHEFYSRILSWIASIPPSDRLSEPELLDEQDTLMPLGLFEGISGNAQTPLEKRGPAGKRRRTADTMDRDLRRSTRLQKTPDKYVPPSTHISGKYRAFYASFSHPDGIYMRVKGGSHVIQHTLRLWTISIGTTLPGTNRSLGPASLRSALESAVPYHFRFSGTTGMPAEVGALLRKVRPNGYDKDVVPKEIKSDPIWNTLETVLDQAADCKAEKASDGNWGSFVALPLLGLYRSRTDGIKPLNVETDPIDSKFLSLSTTLSQTKILAQNTDFCFIFNHPATPPVLAACIARYSHGLSHLAKGQGLCCLGLEMKSCTVHQLKARTQSAVWHAAQLELFNHETISEGKKETGLVRYPPLVALGAYGHEWEINIVSRVGHEVTMYGPWAIGSTDSVEGIYTLHKSLTRAIEWAKTDFCHWVLDWDRESHA